MAEVGGRESWAKVTVDAPRLSDPRLKVLTEAPDRGEAVYGFELGDKGYSKVFSPGMTVDRLAEECRKAGLVVIDGGKSIQEDGFVDAEMA